VPFDQVHTAILHNSASILIQYCKFREILHIKLISHRSKHASVILMSTLVVFSGAYTIRPMSMKQLASSAKLGELKKGAFWLLVGINFFGLKLVL